jgi:hypothetical protein
MVVAIIDHHAACLPFVRCDMCGAVNISKAELEPHSPTNSREYSRRPGYTRLVQDRILMSGNSDGDRREGSCSRRASTRRATNGNATDFVSS